MTWCTEHDPGVRCPWAATWNVHQGTHTGQGVRNTGRGICDAGTKYMTWGHGTQGIKIQQRGPEDPFHVSAWGPSMQQREPIFSSHKGQSVFCLLLLRFCGCQKVGISQRRGAQSTPQATTSSDRGQGLGPSPWLRKSLRGPQLQSFRGSCKRQHWPA